MARKIPVQRYDFSEEDIELILTQVGSLLRSRSFLSMGAHCAEFEGHFADYLGARYAVAVNSGTGALEIILRSFGLAGADVIVPTNTFAATAFAVLHAGATPIFADCGDDLVVDPADVERRLTPATKAVIVVHIGGLVSPAMYRLQELCRSRGLVLIEDAAHAHGSLLDGRHAGTLGDAAAFSFFSTKVMTTGEGGMIATGNEDVARRARVLRDQAKSDGLNRHDDIGYNWRMTELQAILGLVQLGHLREFIDERRRVARIYDEAFDKAAVGLARLPIPPGSQPNFYKYVVFVERDIREVAEKLFAKRRLKLGGAVYDLPCHLQPAFSRLAGDRLPKAEHLCKHHICPPIYPSLTDDDARYVAQSLIEVVS